MDKVQKALAKLYFALGETGAINPADAENSAFMAEYRATIALRGSGQTVGIKYSKLGAAAAARKRVLPQRGKFPVHRKPGKLLPHRSKK
jgi:hypothetical protein